MFDPFDKKTSLGWSGRLAHYAAHQNDEHRQALFAEAMRYSGFHLENDLAYSPYWSRVPLANRAGLLLFLVDRGIVERAIRRGRRVYEPLPHAETWVCAQPSLKQWHSPILEFVLSLRHELQRRARTPRA